LAISQNKTLLLLSSSSSSLCWLFCTAVETTDVTHAYRQITYGRMIVSEELTEV
jgi:hypothetical protein